MTVQQLERSHALLGGQWVPTPETDPVTSPYDGALVGRAPRATPAMARAAIDAAAAAHDAGAPPQHERADILERARGLVQGAGEDLARLMAQEAGKPITAARGEVARCADTLAFAAATARQLAGDVIPFEGSAPGARKLGFTILRPVGVVVAITPFNFPLNLVCHKLAPAFAAGCPVVLKPSEQAPLTALAFAALLVEAGMPPGFLSVLPGPGAELGPALTQDERVAAVTFTGSTRVGEILARSLRRTRVLLELGSNSPALVDVSADLDRCVQRLAATAFAYAGQSCISAQRVLVHRGVADRLSEALVEAARQLVVGDPLDEATDVGPLISSAERERVLTWIDEARSGGARVLTGGEADDRGLVAPTVLDQVDPTMRVVCDEVFGPVLTVEPVADLTEAVAIANRSRFGLHAGVFAEDHRTLMAAARGLRYGGVLLNDSPTFRADQQPYGGFRESGNTREGPPFAVRDYLEPTVVILEA